MKTIIHFFLLIILLTSCAINQGFQEKDIVGKYRLGLSMIKVIELESTLELYSDKSFKLIETMDGNTIIKTGNWSIVYDRLRMVNILDNNNVKWKNQSIIIEIDSSKQISIGSYQKIKN